MSIKYDLHELLRSFFQSRGTNQDGTNTQRRNHCGYSHAHTIHFFCVPYMMQTHRCSQNYPLCDKGHFFVFRDIRNTFWEKFSKQKMFLYCWATFWQHFFVETTNTNNKSEKNWRLLLLVVATNFFTDFFFIIMLARTWKFFGVRSRQHVGKIA